MFKRKIYSKMLNWKQESDGKFSDRILCRYLIYTKDISKE